MKNKWLSWTGVCFAFGIAVVLCSCGGQNGQYQTQAYDDATNPNPGDTSSRDVNAASRS